MQRSIKLLGALLLGLLIGGVDVSQSAQAATPLRTVTRTKKVNYYTKIGPNKTHNYQVYQSGGAKSSAANLTPIATGRQYANKQVHITREQTMADGTWLKFTYNHKKAGWIHRNGTVKSYRWLNVPLIGQRPQLPRGCEVTATTMMLQYAGAKVNKVRLDKDLPRNSNPSKGFNGWVVYPKALMKLVKQHTGTAKNLTGASFKRLKQQLNAGHPVVVWIAWFDGFNTHAITLTGYGHNRAYYNDPWTKKKTSMSLKTLHKHRQQDAYRALSY